VLQSVACRSLSFLSHVFQHDREPILSPSQSASLNGSGLTNKEEVTVHQTLEDSTSQPAPLGDNNHVNKE